MVDHLSMPPAHFCWLRTVRLLLNPGCHISTLLFLFFFFLCLPFNFCFGGMTGISPHKTPSLLKFSHYFLSFLASVSTCKWCIVADWENRSSNCPHGIRKVFSFTRNWFWDGEHLEKSIYSRLVGVGPSFLPESPFIMGHTLAHLSIWCQLHILFVPSIACPQ